MTNENPEGTPVRIGRWSVAPDGSRRELHPLADAATADATGNPYLDLTRIGADLDGIVGPYGVPAPINIAPDPDADPPPHLRPDTDGDDSGDEHPAHESTDAESTDRDAILDTLVVAYTDPHSFLYRHHRAARHRKAER